MASTHDDRSLNPTTPSDRRPHHDTPPVLVLGTGITALGVVRSLGRFGVKTYTGSGPGDLARYSRWHDTLEGWPDQTLPPQELATWLERLPIERAVLMPCSDPWARSLASMDPSTHERFPTCVASGEAIDLLVDKDHFRALLETLDIPHPRTFALDSEEDVNALPAEVYESAFLKPHDSPSFFDRYGVKAWTTRTHEEALARFRQAREAGLGVVCQDYIPGPPTEHVFVDGFRSSTGETQFLARRRLRMFPRDYGNSSAMVTIPLEEASDAVDSLRRILEDLSYRGIFSAEFKHDHRDDRFKLLEINARPWWYVEYASICGLHTCWLAYRDALGLETPTLEPYRVGKVGIHSHQDMNAYRVGRHEGGDGLFSVLSSWLGANHAIFAIDDPRPGLVHYGHVISQAMKRRQLI